MKRVALAFAGAMRRPTDLTARYGGEEFVALLADTDSEGAWRVADAMRRSWTRPLATVGLSVNLEPVLENRATREPKPGPALYVLRALALALAEQPNAAARLIGGRAVRSESSTAVHLPCSSRNETVAPVLLSSL